MSGRDNRAAAVMQQLIPLLPESNPHPNPRVASRVVTADGDVAGTGVHQRPGEPHAEVLALTEAGERARGATLYVTLEPCAHHGRTPPCTDAIVAAGVERVIIAALDPDERVAGAGVERLRNAGIDVETGMLGEDAIAADPGYHHHRRTGRPLITLKLATTIDGQAAAADRTSQWLTGEAARGDAHALRAASDAVLVGAGTLAADDPRLDVRLVDHAGRQPRPVVVAGSRPLPAQRALWERRPLVYAPRPADHAAAEVVEMPGPDGVDLAGVVKDLGARGHLDVLVEGGPTLAASFWAAGLVDRVVWYLAGKIAGGRGRQAIDGAFATLADAIDVDITSFVQLGPDLRIDCVPRGR